MLLFVVVIFLFLPFVLNFGVQDNNAIDIADTTDNQINERLPCNDEEVFDIKMNQCVRFACPPNFKISREEYKCIPVPQPRTNADILEPGRSCLDSLKVYTFDIYEYSLGQIWRGLLTDSTSKNIQTLDLFKDWYVPCAIWIKTGIIYANDFTSSCQLKYRNVHIPKEELYLEKRPDDVYNRVDTLDHDRAYFCATYYYESQCLLHFVNMTNTSIDINSKSLIIKNGGRDIPYSLDKFVPLGELFGVCVVPDPRMNNIRNIQSLVSAVGSSFSITFYIVVLVTFFASEHFPGYGVISMCWCLIFSDCISLLERILYLIRAVIIRKIGMNPFYCDKSFSFKLLNS